MKKLKDARHADTKGDDYSALLGMPLKGEEAIAQIRAGFPYAVIARLAGLSEFSLYELALLLKISKSTLRRRCLAGRFKPDESDHLYRIFTVLEAAVNLFEGDVSLAKEWLNNPQHGLGGRRPIDMAATHVEFEAVINLIGRLEHGVVV